ncbi:hypothetical protein BJX63DRAFT_392559 [Aspergillus granulosus]|uniref:Uncharacterized protein n=1 Tax=Aspergillus granulosus TaxID=176169 RepID=A0ABR4HFJ6_9EURO
MIVGDIIYRAPWQDIGTSPDHPFRAAACQPYTITVPGSSFPIRSNLLIHRDLAFLRRLAHQVHLSCRVSTAKIELPRPSQLCDLSLEVLNILHSCLEQLCLAKESSESKYCARVWIRLGIGLLGCLIPYLRATRSLAIDASHLHQAGHSIQRSFHPVSLAFLDVGMLLSSHFQCGACRCSDDERAYHQPIHELLAHPPAYQDLLIYSMGLILAWRWLAYLSGESRSTFGLGLRDRAAVSFGASQLAR